MQGALGFYEVSGVTAAVTALDIMCKTADVRLVSWERKLGGRLVTLMISGGVSDVTQAMDAAKAGGLVPPCASVVIANPHPETIKIVELSRSRTDKKAAKSGDAPDMARSAPVKKK